VPSARLGWFRPGLGLLSWGCQRSPLHRHSCLESTPSCIAAPRSCLPVGTRRPVPVRHGAAIGPELPRSGRVPSLPFLPASTVCSSRHFSGLLHPETDPGVRHVSGPGLRPIPACVPLPPWSGVGSRGRFGLPARGRRRRPAASLLCAWLLPKKPAWRGSATSGSSDGPGPSPVALHPSECSPRPQHSRVTWFLDVSVPSTSGFGRVASAVALRVRRFRAAELQFTPVVAFSPLILGSLAGPVPSTRVGVVPVCVPRLSTSRL
jgi:hypothetical protein